MDLVFNELSSHPLAENKTKGFERVILFLETFKRSKEFDYNKIRFDVPKSEDILSKTLVTSEYTLADYRKLFLQDRQNKRYGDLLLGLPKRPFIDENSEEENQFIQNTYQLYKEAKIFKPFGLASAYIYSTLGIGFNSEPFWDVCKFELIIISEFKSKGTVFCVSKPEHFNNGELTEFIENRSIPELIETNILPKDKRIELRDDHGKNVLKNLSERLVQSPYVKRIINSLPYNPYEKYFIKAVYPNGNIEIVLTDTDEGFGVIIESTGRNKRETQEIAKILENLYN
jgi:hypothetical protein